jgi:HlyD family secretion protein
LLSGTTIEELAQAEQAVKQAAAHRDLLEVDLSRHDIRAPVDGIVDSRLFELGERPAPGQTILVMLPGEQPYARVYIPEYLRVQVSVGIPAVIHVDGLETAIEGRVRWVASEAAFTPYYALTERDRGHLTYLAKVDVAEDRARLPDGVPVEVDLMLSDPGE